MCDMHDASTAFVCPMLHSRSSCRVIKCWNRHIWSWFTLRNVSFVQAPTDDCCVRTGCVDIISDDVPTEYHPWSFDPWWKNRAMCLRRGCKIGLIYNPSTAFQFRRQMSKWPNLVVFHTWKWRIRRTCHHIFDVSRMGALIWKVVVIR